MDSDPISQLYRALAEFWNALARACTEQADWAQRAAIRRECGS